MKRSKLIDILPTAFGLIALSGVTLPGLWNGVTGLGPVLLFGGGAATLITGIASAIIANRNHTFNGVHSLNVGWAAVSGIALLLVLFYAAHPLQYTF